MEQILIALLLIIALFFVFIIVKNLFPKICAICAAISLTWIILIILYWLKIFNDNVIIPLLIGQSIVGIFYLLEKKVKKEFEIFKLPFLLTLTLLGYSIITKSLSKTAFLIIITLWVIFFLLHVLKNKLKTIYKKILECCSRW